MRYIFWVFLLIVSLIYDFTFDVIANGENPGINNNQLEKPVESEEKKTNWITILEMEDPKGDDYGPGTYIYPTNVQFAPYQGILDIERFKVLGTEEKIRFQITFGQITNPWKGPYGFSHQLIQIYIDHRPGGEHNTLYPGARVVFSPRALWDTLIKVTGWGFYLFDCTDKPTPEPEPCPDGKVKVLDDQKTIEITLPINNWSNFHHLQDGAFYLLVGGQDGFGPDNYRIVKKEVNEWYFGGGDDLGYGPNVIDIVVPPGRNQKQILGSYDPINHVRAVVEPVSRPNPLRKGIIYLVSILTCILIWFGWRKRDIFIRST